MYATSTYHVGKAWLNSLRTAISEVLLPNRSKANAWLAVEYVSKHIMDPEHYVIQQSIVTCRSLVVALSSQRQKQFYKIAAGPPLRPLQVRGPAGALSLNLARVGWTVTKTGEIHTDHQVSLHLTQSSLSDLKQFLQYSWSKHVIQTALQRPCWRNNPVPDRRQTLAVLQQFPVEQQAVIARDIVGAHVSTAQKNPFCGW